MKVFDLFIRITCSESLVLFAIQNGRLFAETVTKSCFYVFVNMHVLIKLFGLEINKRDTTVFYSESGGDEVFHVDCVFSKLTTVDNTIGGDQIFIELFICYRKSRQYSSVSTNTANGSQRKSKFGKWILIVFITVVLGFISALHFYQNKI